MISRKPRLNVKATFSWLTLLGLTVPFNSLFAEGRISGDWIWNVDDKDVFWAAAQNNAGHFIGQSCYLKDGDCVYIVHLGSICEAGAEYPAMINSDSGSASVKLTCVNEFEPGKWMFIIHPFDDVDTFVRSALHIGIAVPMEGGQFKVDRFSLKGSKNAIDLMRQAAKAFKARGGEEAVGADEQFL